MTIKHGAHTFNIDPSTTDTYRHYHEGHAERVAMVAPDKFALVMRWSDEIGPEEIAARHMADADIVICEGFKKSSLPKIEIFRTEAHPTPLWGGPEVDSTSIRVMVSDDSVHRQGVHSIGLNDPSWLASLADHVEQTIMKRAR